MSVVFVQIKSLQNTFFFKSLIIKRNQSIRSSNTITQRHNSSTTRNLTIHQSNTITQFTNQTRSHNDKIHQAHATSQSNTIKHDQTQSNTNKHARTSTQQAWGQHLQTSNYLSTKEKMLIGLKDNPSLLVTNHQHLKTC